MRPQRQVTKQAVRKSDGQPAKFKSEQNVISLLNHVATIATVAEELCSSGFQWGIKTPTETLNVPAALGGIPADKRQPGHLRQGYNFGGV